MEDIDLAVKYFEENNFDEAEKIALQLFNKNNSSTDGLDVLCAIYYKTKNLNCFKDNNVILFRKMAEFYINLKMYEEVIFFYKKIIESDKNDYIAYNNLGLTYENIDDIALAKECYEKSIAIKENYSAVYNLGVLYRKLQNLPKSEMLLKKAYNLNPNNPYASYSLSMTLLMQKKFTEGYPYFLKRPVKNIEGLQNFWDGKKYPDKTILVYCEYGLGDGIMFSRYFEFLKNYFAKVKVCCNSSLIKLFVNSFNDIEYVNDFQNTQYDFSVLLMNLPYFLNMDFENIPFTNGYLKADEGKIQEYKQKYFDNNNFKIGLFYIGGELHKRNARYRAIELSYFEKLFNIKNAKFYSFQKKDVYSELVNYPDIIDLGQTFNDFSDTAAAMKNLDLMITIDSSPVHLAGALGIKTLLLLPYFSEWRWFQDERSTPWYNSVELIRQTAACNWEEVIDKVYNIFPVITD